MAIVTFDAAGSNPDGTDPGTALNIGPGSPYKLRSFNAPAPQQTVQYASSVDTEGGTATARKHENRVIDLEIMCDNTAALQTLQGKIGKLAREGGTLKWTLPNGTDTVILDLLAVDAFAPVINAEYYATGNFPVVSISLPAKPYGRGASTTLTDHTELTNPALIFTETGIKGDMPAWVEIIADNDAGVGQDTLLWGIQSREYDATSTAALFWEAESLTLGSGALNAGPAGASGGGANKTVKQTNAGTAISTSTLTSAGVFRLYARIQVPATNTGTVSVKANYQRPTDFSLTNNDFVVIDPSYEGKWLIVDLGEIRMKRATKGTHGWTLTTSESMTVATDVVYYDWFLLLPVEEGSGIISGTGADTGIPLSAALRSDGVFIGNPGTSLWGTPYKYEGDYPLLPPAGLESRTLRAVFKFSRGLVYVSGDVLDVRGPIYEDAATDDLSARVTYQPRWLVVPSP